MGTDAGAVRAYSAFCREYGQIYRRYAGAVIGDAAVGRTLADAALQELGVQWPYALRSADPCALGWVLLRAATASRRTPTVRALQRALRPQEVDALVLHYRLGLSAAGRAARWVYLRVCSICFVTTLCVRRHGWTGAWICQRRLRSDWEEVRRSKFRPLFLLICSDGVSLVGGSG